MPNGQPILHWYATGFCPVFGESTARSLPASIAQKSIDWAKRDLNHHGKSTNHRLTTMKFLFPLFVVFEGALLVLERPITLGETFTEGVRVSTGNSAVEAP